MIRTPIEFIKIRGKMIRKVARKHIPTSIRKRIRSSFKAYDSNPRKKRNHGLYQLKHQYTIVSAVFNAADYLDDYFSSIFEQTCDTRNISIVLVDDGSSDRSAEIISEWQERHPGRITYYYQVNSGPGAARNKGLGAVSTEWVTFVDSDDKLAPNYFEEVDKAISNHPALILATCRVAHWYMSDNSYWSESLIMRHFANRKENSYYAIGDEQMPTAFFMNATFFRTSLIKSNDILIDEALRPNFEDGKFIAQYLLSADEGTVGFLVRAHYLYRKRSDGSSIIDTSWSDPGKYFTVTRRGYLQLLQFAKQKCGHVPLNIQQTVLQDTSWYFKRFENHPGRFESIGSENEQLLFLDTFRDIYSYLTPEALFKVHSDFIPFRRKVGIARTLMGATPPYMLCKLRKLWPKNRLMLIETYDKQVQFYFDGRKTPPLETKRASATFCGFPFYDRYQIWLEYPENAQIFSFRLPNGAEVRLDIREKKTFRRSICMKTLLNRYTEDWAQYRQDGDTWIIMDRDTQADDNGEHFYRYLMQEHPEQKAKFALRKDSRDWRRLEKEGFDLIDFGSEEYERELRKSSKIISSHADDYVLSYFGDKYYDSKDFIFLQHGIIMNDLSSWLNTFVPNVMLTSTPQETNYIAQDGSPYLYTSRQVQQTGLPRHDLLLKKRAAHLSSKKQSTLLILPTWRRYLSGRRLGASSAMAHNEHFAESDYATKWQAFLLNEQLHGFAEEHSLRIVFYPHPNVLQYIEAGDIVLPPYIELGFPSEERSFQDYVAEAALCVTDYSSAALDVSLSGIPVTYYQFDKTRFFSGDHGVDRGYFEFDRDGFGPVASTEEECLEAIETIALQGFEMAPKYAERAAETFTMADGHCCERAYEAIINL